MYLLQNKKVEHLKTIFSFNSFKNVYFFPNIQMWFKFLATIHILRFVSIVSFEDFLYGKLVKHKTV